MLDPVTAPLVVLAQLRQHSPEMGFSENIFGRNGVTGRVQFAWVHAEAAGIGVVKVESRCSEDFSA
jgi:hypothetical protein